jgi:Rap1a immunity proteins
MRRGRIAANIAKLPDLLREVFSCVLRAVVVGGSLFWSAPAFAAFDSGETLFDNCNNPNDASKQFYCLGYLAGVSDLLEGMHITCSGKRISLDKIKDAVLKYLREHPEQRGMEADDLVATALVLAFPCK